jgi:hypothetical protein
VAALGDRIIVYVNGQYAGEIRDNSLQRGKVSLMAGTYDESDESGCSFRNAWLWALPQ